MNNRLKQKKKVLSSSKLPFLAEFRRFTENIVATVREPLLVLDGDLKVIFANESFYSTFKVHPEKTIGKKVFDLGNGQWDIPPLLTLLFKILPQRSTVDNFIVEHTFETIGHKVMSLNARKMRIFEEEQDEFILLSIEDITKAKEAEDILRRSKAAVEVLVRQRTAELLRAERQLDRARRLSDIGTLASTVAHELRNPLAAISMAAHNITRKTKEPASLRSLSTINKKVSESDQIINNLLFYSRLKQPQFEPVNICDTVKESIQLLKAVQTGRNSFAVEVDCLSKTRIAADPVQIREVFSNILNNAADAVKASPKGLIRIIGIEDNEGVSIRIADNGTGMSKETLRRASEPFYTTKSKGTGLGLAVTKQIIELHNGSLQIESEEGKGTAVTVRFPKLIV